ncbi:lipoprotein and hemagglutinin (VlhA) family protein [Mycoplasmoides gallisepticum]|uniref:Lipoprotein and hemagglutinin (VlhA) family protein n=2 Tax=Mycoplasmoides gallisepticum TaxID=2096 RepID=A0A3B0PRU7_MYCGL|nr:lipoprotein and hemagglutinin (VlhA) family protein [Mycoplasmoides gallisepticum]SYV95259.1 lipoprotein and hemagglutinin (VlhA) family protein [Mycoplasmoides gallisepticum]
MTSTTVSGTGTPMKRTLTLNQGLNKIVVSGVNNGDTPFIGNLTFTLESNQTISEQVEPSSATAEKNI